MGQHGGDVHAAVERLHLVQASARVGVIAGDPCFRLGLFVDSTLQALCEENGAVGAIDPETSAVSGVFNQWVGGRDGARAAPTTSSAVVSSGLACSFVNILKVF